MIIPSKIASTIGIIGIIFVVGACGGGHELTVKAASSGVGSSAATSPVSIKLPVAPGTMTGTPTPVTDAPQVTDVPEPTTPPITMAASAFPSAAYVGPVASQFTYPDAGITLEPPLASQIPTASWETAYLNACTTGNAICRPGVAPVISLALATTPNAGQANSNGSITPLVNGALVYVMTWDGTTCPRLGGPPASSQADTLPTQEACDLVNFLDANTGQGLYAFSYPTSGAN